LDVRRITLGEWSWLDFIEDRQTRNEDVHGGSIISDITLISTFPEQESNRLKLWKNAFELAYGIPYHRLQKIARDLPDQLRVVLNRRASALTMLSWRKKADCAHKIKDKADIIIKSWEENAPDIFQDGPQ